MNFFFSSEALQNDNEAISNSNGHNTSLTNVG